MAKQCFLTLYPDDIVNKIGSTSIANTKVNDMPASYGYLAMDNYWCSQPGGTPDDAVLITPADHAMINMRGTRAEGGAEFNVISSGWVGQHPSKPH